MTYEYNFISVLTEKQVDSLQMGLIEPDQVLELVKVKLNEQAAQGWEPLVPFGLPVIWFRKKIIDKAVDNDITSS